LTEQRLDVEELQRQLKRLKPALRCCLMGRDVGPGEKQAC
jgi:hypothetical protein